MRLPEPILTVFVVIIMAGLVLVPTAQVIMRGVFVLPFIGAEEFTRFLLIFLPDLLRLPARRGARREHRHGRVQGSTSGSAEAHAERADLPQRLSGDRLHRLRDRDQHIAQPANATPTLGIPFWLFLGARCSVSPVRRSSTFSTCANRRRPTRTSRCDEHGVCCRHRLPGAVPDRLPGGLRRPLRPSPMCSIEGLPLGLLRPSASPTRSTPFRWWRFRCSSSSAI